MKNYDKIFEPLETGAISERIINRITDAIINGILKPGDKIPTEVEFSENLKVGRNAVREAMKILVAYGVLEIRRSEGTFIVKEFNHKMLDPLIYGILLQDSSMEQLLELKITFLRSILYMAVKKATERDIEDLERQHEKFCKAIEENPEDIELLYTENLNFHICLADICHNPMIIQMNNVILKMSKYSRMKGIETAIKNNDAASLANATSNLLKVVKHRDIREVEVVVDKIYNLWLEIVLDKKTA